MKYILIILMVFYSTVGSAQDFEGVKKINGTNIFFSIKGTGENLILLHGGPGLNHRYFKPYLSGLEKKFRLVYYDQRSSGRSSSPAADSISVKFLVEDLEAIRRDLKIEKLNLLAHSWGAVLATYYAMAYPKRVNKVIFSNPAMLSREYDIEAAGYAKKKTTKEDSVLRAQIMSDANMDVNKYDQLIHLSFRTSAYDRKKIEKLDLGLPPQFVEANKALFTGLMKDPAMRANVYESLKTFDFPVLIIHGVADIIPFASIEKMKHNLHHAELVIMEQSGHFPFVEETKKYTELITTFLEKSSKKSRKK